MLHSCCVLTPVKAPASTRDMKHHMLKAFWIYVVALALFAFTFPTFAQDATKPPETNKAPEAKAKPAATKPAVQSKTETKKETKKGKEMLAIFETNKGTFKIKLFADKAPKTVENFVGLAEGTKEYKDPKTQKMTKGKYYDGLVFHRVIPNFMIQGGDPLGTGTGGPGYTFGDEIVPDLKHDKPGILSMANAGPGTNGSQFFVTVAKTPWLDGKHTVFGEVVEGMDVVMAISLAKTQPGDRPAEPIMIKTLKIEKL